jgi:hypothetical protein
MKYKPQEFAHENVHIDVLLAVLAAYDSTAIIGTPNHNLIPDAGVNYRPHDIFVYNDVDKILEMFWDDNDKLFFKYFLDRGMFIKGYDRAHSPHIDQLSQEICDGAGASIYLGEQPITAENGDKIFFHEITPLCQCAVNDYLYYMLKLLQAKAEANIITIDQTKYNLKELESKAGGLLKSLEDKCYVWTGTLPPCPDEIEKAILSDKDIRDYLKSEGVKISSLQKSLKKQTNQK